MTIDIIETAETVPAKTLIDQALENIKGYGRLVSVAPDRGFPDGDLRRTGVSRTVTCAGPGSPSASTTP